MSGIANEPGANSANPAREMTPRSRCITLYRGKIPKGAQPADPVRAGISRDESRRYGSGGRPGHPVQRKRSLRERLVDPGMIGRKSKTSAKNHSDGSRRVLHLSIFERGGNLPGLASINPVTDGFVPSDGFYWFHPCSMALGTEALLFDYIKMQGHLNRKQFTRCAWSAALMLVGSAAAIIGAIGYLAK